MDDRERIAQRNNTEQEQAWEREANEMLRGKRLHTYSQDTRAWQLLALAMAKIERLRSSSGT